MKKFVCLVGCLFTFGCVYTTTNFTATFTNSSSCTASVATDAKKIITPNVSVPASALAGALSGGAAAILPLVTGK